MRIISGSNKGKRIIAPKKLPVRPTTDMAKEGLFNILNNHYHFSALRVLDLFSGTGNIAYEFASRGAEAITAVDGNFECIKFIKKTAGELDYSITAIKSDVFKYLERAPIKADVIFADPPYNFSDVWIDVMDGLWRNKLVKHEGMVVTEHRFDTGLDAEYDGLFRKTTRRYGDTAVSIFGLGSVNG